MRRVRDTHAETNYSESVRMPRVRRRRSRAEETQHTLAEREKWGNLFLVWMFWIRLSPFIPLSIPHTHLCKRKRQEISFVTEAYLRFVANVVPRLLSPFKSRALFFLRRLLLLQNENKEKTNRYRNSVWKDRRKGRRPWNPSGRYGRVPRPVFFPLSFLSSSLFRLSPLSAAGCGVNGAWSMGFNTVYIYIYIYLWGLWWHHHPREVDAADCFRLLSFSFLFFSFSYFLIYLREERQRWERWERANVTGGRWENRATAVAATVLLLFSVPWAASSFPVSTKGRLLRHETETIGSFALTKGREEKQRQRKRKKKRRKPSGIDSFDKRRIVSSYTMTGLRPLARWWVRQNEICSSALLAASARGRRNQLYF